ncbi:MAG: ParB/RepB/Spo0J family partition protein, partial [Halochromatium sp.]|uniref:ParB/RepB/Spo0J family partition protein n=1 Tax=Halochromatium sp. TaxID=2049430 RepID=UPI003978C9DC
MAALRKKGLGRGLDALLGGARDAAALAPNPEPTAAHAEAPSGPVISESVRELALDQIQRGRYQPRRDFDAERMRELADSIAAQGVIQPILVRPLGADRYELIAGERRWRASQQAGLERIPVVVREVSEQAALAIALIENIQRDDLNPLEEAGALRRLLDEFGLSHQQVAEAVGKSRSTVSNLLRLLELEDGVKALLDEGRLEMGHARALLGVRGDVQLELARQVVARGLSVRETERLIRRIQVEAEAPAGAPFKPDPDPNIRRLQDDLAERLGARVAIQHGRKGTGRLVINYNSLDELDGILA